MTTLMCPKQPHDRLDGGYLHRADDDTPYTVDGVSYCGRCHHVCSRVGVCLNPANAPRATLAELRVKASDGPWFTVPRGAREADCRSACAARGLYWTTTSNKKRMLVDTLVADGKKPTFTEDGRGVAHFATCPFAVQFRTRNNTRSRR